MTSAAFTLLAALSLSACAVGPRYHRPEAAAPAAFKEAEGWKAASPADALDRGPWWELYNDPVLSDLERRVATSNQTVAALAAAYRQSIAFVSEQRAALFPVVSLDGSVNVAHGGSGTTTTTTGATTGSGTRTSYQIGLQASWAPDLFGRVRNTVENARASAQASAGDYASGLLAAQSALAIDYVQLRALDEDERLLKETVAAYDKALTVTRNRYAQGVAAKSDVLTAETQLLNAQAALLDDTQTRAQLEHAIAVLVGEAPATFSLAPAAWTPAPPDVPVAVPSALLERRPDVAAAERRAAAANALIGVNQAAYFPTLDLTGSAGLSGISGASASAWSLGASLLQTLFDAGARRARVRESRAAFDQAVANYRQTVLNAFQQVEDELVASRVLAQDYALRARAAEAATQAETIAFNQYRAGTFGYTDVVVVQTTALNARRAALTSQRDRLVASVSLIQALGGGWSAATPPPSR